MKKLKVDIIKENLIATAELYISKVKMNIIWIGNIKNNATLKNVKNTKILKILLKKFTIMKILENHY